ncbi:aldo/keto reductase [Caldisalinibacter kiritimatiensis]|uniref:Oxidoreductase, aldo/keto reductase family n=1 Tax=Caldisalinibacter kiritimatiensis TaxID=1304284 RepID=R1AYQ1_9FIRM|nr:aldo/keto reductase [Caldisalinibacter kiritimatiensis]EOD01837.1 Oxidoreductase, aldo/keto reductase family [Caldisalinibacter kiritimatiensis]
MEKIRLSDTLKLSRIVQGFMRLSDWNMSKEERLNFIEQCIDMGITSFDHADIYGGYICEELFGEALELKPQLRDKMEIITKCGIKIISPNRPEHRVKHYDTSKEHIINSVNNSLKNLRTDYIDLLLIHRPDPFMNPEEVAEAFNTLYRDGKVRNFGVSNFTPSQFNMLSSYLDMPLVTNQIEISVMQYENFRNGTIDLCLEKRIPPLAWSPLAGGKVFTSEDEKSVRLRNVLEKIADELNVDGIDKIMYAWLLNHPAKIIPIVGSGKISRVKRAVESLDIKLDRQQWFEILEASNGRRVP